MKPADIAKLLDPALADLRRDLSLLIAEHANAIVAEVRTATLDGVRARLTGGGMSAEEQPAKRTPRAPKRTAVKERGAAPTASKSARRCRNCREPGHRANKCPNASASDDEEGADAPAPRPPVDREERAAAIREAMADRLARQQLAATAPRKRGRPRKGEVRPLVDPDAPTDDGDDDARSVTDELLAQVPVLKTYAL